MTELQVREFATEMHFRQDAEGHHIAEGLVVPYGAEAPIIEVREDGPVRYREMFTPGAFERAQRVPHRVTLAYGHSESLADRLGYATDLRDTAAGLWAAFRIDRSRWDVAQEALTSSHTAFSVGFVSISPRPFTEREGELVVRKAVHLSHVAAVPQGAYAAALVSSVRGAFLDDVEEPSAVEVAERAAQAAAEAETQAARARAAELFEFFGSAKNSRWATPPA
jgi:HK97 family phage prohead protease